MEMSQLKSLVMGNKLQSAWALLHMSYLFLSFWFYIPYFGWNVVAYHRPLKVSMILYAFSTYTELGMPQFNREYLRKMLDSGNTHFLLYSIIFIIDDETRLGAALWPLFVYSTFQVFNWVKLSFVPAVAPSVAAEFRSFELTRMFEQMRQPALVMAADLEVKLFFIILVFAILGLFGVGNQQLAGVFFYYQLLRLRYRVSPETQRSVAMTKHTVDGYLYSARCPEMIRNLYVKALTWVGYV
ncbi:hypothetical protein SARC_03913 [Sphaeroforma arctica JP610]|uniref:Uncharacterized protein n=1 Tax=Sphaeroforma arctica JP610 TaxID=667725 RepID=A0A0L0G4W0_9EUKA|nr:hypothetical protein SARC_03913 [Sphaeroforma arctica JP610]KNC83856.1 hypothetical protein SARC_03913 [Sphaeroforma arctica JP610]|eukprot:XP_014157758.1 hypothetical protein SARC_03913 [Sphaeroforma arctica JP610]